MLVGVRVGVFVGVEVGVAVGVLAGVSVAVFAGVSVGVLVGVFVGVSVGVSVGVLVLVGVSVNVAVGVIVGVLVLHGSKPVNTWPQLSQTESAPKNGEFWARASPTRQSQGSITTQMMSTQRFIGSRSLCRRTSEEALGSSVT